MNTGEYIASGILEAYVLGALTLPEQQEVEAQMRQHAEVGREVLAISETMFKFAGLYAIDPPAALRSSIEESLAVAGNKAGAVEAAAGTGSSRIPLNPVRRTPTIEWRNAAALIVLVCSLAVNYVFWNNGRHQQKEKDELATQMTKLQTQQQQLASELNDYKSSKAMMADTAIQTVVMHTVVTGHPMAATLYWSKGNGDAYVAMDALPRPPEGMQYQLWVIQNGKPVSMGTLPNNMANTPVMQKVNMQVTSADAFAISLEKRGGNASPTTVYVMGKA